MTRPDHDAYDALVDTHCFPTVYDDGDDLALSPATARAAHLQDVADSLPATSPAPSPGSDHDARGSQNPPPSDPRALVAEVHS